MLRRSLPKPGTPTQVTRVSFPPRPQRRRLPWALWFGLMCVVSLLGLRLWSALPEPVSPELQAKRARVAATVAQELPKTQARMQAQEEQHAAQRMLQAEADSRLTEVCSTVAPRAFRHPSTVRRAWWYDTTITRTAPQKATVVMYMKAKNSFGLELVYSVTCRMERGRVIDLAVHETS